MSKTPKRSSPTKSAAATVDLNASARRAAPEAEGEAYAVRMPGAESADVDTLNELGQVAKRLTKKDGGRDAA